MAKTNYNPHETTARACEIAGIEGYDKNQYYDNPAKNADLAMAHNWDNNLVPKNVVHMIAQSETIAHGIAKAAEITLENTLNHRFFEGVQYSDMQEVIWFCGVAEEIALRFGKGAFGEQYVAENADLDGKVEDPKEGDENKGIDIRTENATYQVKTGKSFKSSWDKKQADHLIWVEMKDMEIEGYEIME